MESAFGFINFDDLPSDVSKPPVTGIEYLRQVQQEAANCAEVVVAETPANLKEMRPLNGENKDSERGERLKSDKILASPTLKAQQLQAAEFACLRQKFTQYKTKTLGKSLKPLPTKQNTQTWCGFCFGETFLKRSYKDCLSDEILSEFAGKKGQEPLLSVLEQFTQPLAVKVLEYQLTWIDLVGFSIEQGRWLYGLMLCIDRPTPQDAMALLRTMARKCLEIRASLNETSNLIPQLNLIIVLVSKYFGQNDISLV